MDWAGKGEGGRVGGLMCAYGCIGRIIGTVSLMPVTSLPFERVEKSAVEGSKLPWGNDEQWFELGYWLDPTVCFFPLFPLPFFSSLPLLPESQNSPMMSTNTKA